MHGMTCRECVDFLCDYLEGTLPAEASAEFQRHMDLCGACKDYLATYAEAIRLSKLACRESERRLPGKVPESLVQAVLKARERMQQGGPGPA